jgi:transposase-like protein
MVKKSPRFSREIKKKAVDEFVSGQKTAQQLADELGYKVCCPGTIDTV